MAFREFLNINLMVFNFKNNFLFCTSVSLSVLHIGLLLPSF